MIKIKEKTSEERKIHFTAEYLPNQRIFASASGYFHRGTERTYFVIKERINNWPHMDHIWKKSTE